MHKAERTNPSNYSLYFGFTQKQTNKNTFVFLKSSHNFLLTIFFFTSYSQLQWSVLNTCAILLLILAMNNNKEYKGCPLI